MNYETASYLCHHGVKGMKWGVRKKSDKVPFRTNRQAKKDAKEFARAKMFYGEGAGNRRKLIKAQVNERSKDPKYKQAFDKHLNSQDMAKHATKAKSERQRKDVKNSAKKTARGVFHQYAGHAVSVTATAAATYAVLHKTGIDKEIGKWAAIKVKNMKLYYDMAKKVYGKKK